MPQFSRRTLQEACGCLNRSIQTHASFEGLAYRLGLDNLADHAVGGLAPRILGLFRYLKDRPEATCDDGETWDVVVAEAAAWGGAVDVEPFRRSLERDGFVIDGGRLRRALPEDVQLPEADDEVHQLLEQLNLTTALGHLDQAIDAHSRGDWAAANGQLRTFIESLFDDAAVLLGPVGTADTATGETRRQLLANMNPAFLSRTLNEWSDDGKNFVNGLFKRLHPQGPHPGLSDEEDSTFRLHIVLLTARLFLRRLATQGR